MGAGPARGVPPAAGGPVVAGGAEVAAPSGVADARAPRRGRLIVLAGPSGVGKSSIVAELRKALPELHFSVSATTRAPRAGEVDGVHYHFVDRAEFDRLIDEGALLEWAEVHGGLQRSGTPREPVERALAAGRPVLVEVDLQGARSVKAAVPECVTVFVEPPSFEELARRLTDRGTESAETRERRLRTAVEEMAARDEFDVVLVNDEVPAVVARLVELAVGPDGSPPAVARGSAPAHAADGSGTVPAAPAGRVPAGSKSSAQEL